MNLLLKFPGFFRASAKFPGYFRVFSQGVGDFIPGPEILYPLTSRNTFWSWRKKESRTGYAIGSLPTLQISLGIVALFEKIYDGKSILLVVSNIGEDVQYRCFN